MLPYTPLHHLLLAAVARPIVLTSGNVSDEPIAYRDDEARARLAGIADAFLTHDRADPRPDRRLGGPDVPRPADAAPPLPRLRRPSRSPSPPAVPAAGAGLRRRAEEHVLPGPGRPRLRLAPHRRPGELRDAALVHRGHRALPPAVRHRPRRWSRTTCTRSTCPPSTRSSLDGVHLAGVQHHHAHIASCLADNGEAGPVIGVAFDGTGYGTDGTIWGGEFLARRPGRRSSAAGTWRRCRMPGGAAAIRQPWRMAAAYLTGVRGRGRTAAMARRNQAGGTPWWRWPPGHQLPADLQRGPAVRRGRRPPRRPGHDQLRGPGRGRARAARRPGRDRRVPGRGVDGGGGPFRIRGVRPPARRRRGPERPASAPAVIAARFHHGVAAADRGGLPAAAGAARPGHGGAVRRRVPEPAAAATPAVAGLEARGFRVLLHARVPCNDGGISLGQAVVAASRVGGVSRS